MSGLAQESGWPPVQWKTAIVVSVLNLPEREAGSSSQYGAEVKNKVELFTALYAFMEPYLVKQRH
jgi:hypothetical protein